jgi:hypothetical protein
MEGLIGECISFSNPFQNFPALVSKLSLPDMKQNRQQTIFPTGMSTATGFLGEFPYFPPGR